MSLYPSFEALTIGKETIAQNNLEKAAVVVAAYSQPGTSVNYGDLAKMFLGTDLSLVSFDDFGNPCYADSIKPTASNSTVIPTPSCSVVPCQPAGVTVPKDPVSVSQQVRELRLQKDKRGVFGIQLKDLDAGVFISYVESDSVAASAGLRFGDQVLKINDEYMAGKKGKQALQFMMKCGETVTLVIRDRPLERVVTLTKDSNESIGLLLENGLIKYIVQGSSAERNGILTHTYVCEVNGVNVLGMSDRNIRKLLKMAGTQVKLTLIPKFYFDELTKRLGSRHWRGMDRTLPLY